MLVLTRTTDQKIQIGEHITVTVVRVKGGAVRIGIEAPPGVKILRNELLSTPRSPQVAEASDPAPHRVGTAAGRQTRVPEAGARGVRVQADPSPAEQADLPGDEEAGACRLLGPVFGRGGHADVQRRRVGDSSFHLVQVLLQDPPDLKHRSGMAVDG